MHILDIDEGPGQRHACSRQGLEASKGVISVQYGKDPARSDMEGRYRACRRYFDYMAKYFPGRRQDEHSQYLRLFDRAAARAGAQNSAAMT